MVKKLSFLQSAQFIILFLIPSYTQGLFTRRRFWVSFWSRLNVDRFAVRFVLRLRSKHGGRLSLRIGRTPTVILLDHNEIKDVLANSPREYVGAESKQTGMSHFQPGAVTISRGEEWKDRRRFNEAVLNTGRSAHEYANRFSEVAIRAVSEMEKLVGRRLEWEHFDALFEQVASEVIFGTEPRVTRPLFDRLNRLMRESNRVSGLKKSRHFDPFYSELAAHLRQPQEGSLAALCLQTSHSDATRVENQVPHWMFAIRETLPANTVRALALIVAHPGSEQRVRDELMWANELSAGKIDRLTYLGGCVQEAMRLWPTTPFIARQTLSGSEQILILNTFNHRDSDTSLTANAFYPDQWVGGTPDLPFNHLSSGTQVCAGKDLALFLAKAVLAVLLRKDRYVLRRPRVNSQKPVPFMYNYFKVSFERKA